jgi:site-specific DNA recombinase
MKKAVAYIRVSTDGQAGEDRFGLAAQRDAIESWSASNGYEIVQWYSDEGFSGGTAERPGLQSMLADSFGFKGIDRVLVAKMDRVARDLYIQLFVEKELIKSGIEIFSVSEPFFGNDPMMQAFKQMMGVFAQLEKSMISARMSGGRKQKAKTGGYSGGAAAIGYKAALGSKVLEVDEEKIATVRRCFEIRSENPDYTLQRIADQLNDEGHTTKRGARFTPKQVSRIFEREAFYRGDYIYSGIQSAGQHVSIL